jgi:hypothetical protein
MEEICLLCRMITIGIIFIAEGEGASASDLTVANFAGIPKLYGVAVYRFAGIHLNSSSSSSLSLSLDQLLILIGSFFGISI